MNHQPNKPVADLMSTQVVKIAPGATLREAMALMRFHRVSSVVIANGPLSTGILTERDVLHAISARPQALDHPCGQFVGGPAITLDAKASYLEAYHLMAERRIRHLVLTDDSGTVVGLLSESDIVRELGLEYFLQFRDVGSVMSGHLCCLPPTATLAAAVAHMDQEGHTCVIVTDATRAPLGILTERDIVRIGLDQAEPHQLPLQQLMSAPVATIGVATPLPQAMAHMAEHHVRRLVVVDELGGVMGLLGYRDITRGLEQRYAVFLREMLDRQAAEFKRQHAQLDANAFLDNVLRTSGSTALVAADLEQRVQYANVAAAELFGKPLGEMHDCALAELLGDDAAGRHLPLILDSLTLAGRYRYEFSRPTKRGIRHVDSQWSLLHDHGGTAQGYLLIAHDITGRRRAESALQASEERFRTIFNSVNDAIFVYDIVGGTIVDANARIFDMFGYTPQEVLGMSIDQLSAGVAPYTQRHAIRYFNQTAHGHPQTFEWIARHHDGHLFWVEVTMRLAQLDGHEHVLVSVRDISERKAAAEQISRMNWALSALSRGNAALVHADSVQEMCRHSCSAITDQDAYALAYVAVAGEQSGEPIRIMACAGSALAFLGGDAAGCGSDPLAQGPVGHAFSDGSTVVYDNIAAAEALRPWRERLLQHGLAALIAVPLRGHDGLIGELAVYATVPEAFGPQEVKLFEELADDLAFGMENRSMRSAYEASLVEREQHATQLRDTLEQAIGALGATLEKRDPYTAGHERRVADLAVAIGHAMGLDQQQLHGLRLAGFIHDIGKVQIPSELLSKPSRLTAVEFELIKQHADAGYDILKDIDFPWPIAEMVRQHHERIDGSGYPRGLRGDELLLESKILAVADIVEAMSSHRPYRPARGIEPALEEITAQRGTRLDSAAVDTCLRLFTEQGYTFPE